MKKIALFFGSFNPLHRGHTTIATTIVDRGLCDELWLVVSPFNPLKDRLLLADGEQRLKAAKMAVASLGYGQRIKVCDVEFSMNVPSYTIDTLKVLSLQNPQSTFSIVMGSDNMVNFDQWKDYKYILENYQIIVYPRCGASVPNQFSNNVTMVENVPQLDISSTEIRAAIKLSGDQIGHLSGLIEQDGADHNLYFERGLAYQRVGQKHDALNDFLRVIEIDPHHNRAKEHIKMLREIFEFANKDAYNV